MKESQSVGMTKDRTMSLLVPKIEELAMSAVARSILIGGKSDETIIFGHRKGRVKPFITEDTRVVNRRTV